uniref:DNA-directed DNA polymerase n=2 Tax=Caenorhabditis tropicalis TaxID=1561998 RepID=A0A1I7TX25_9PELO
MPEVLRDLAIVFHTLSSLQLKNVPAYERAEDPTFVLQNNIPLDTKNYLTSQLAKPLARIFEPNLGDRAEKILVEGEHTRVRTVVQSEVGGLAAFTKKSATCLGCKSVLPKMESENAVCKHCEPKLHEIFAPRKSSQRTAEANTVMERFGNPCFLPPTK